MNRKSENWLESVESYLDILTFIGDDEEVINTVIKNVLCLTETEDERRRITLIISIARWALGLHMDYLNHPEAEICSGCIAQEMKLGECPECFNLDDEPILTDCPIGSFACNILCNDDYKYEYVSDEVIYNFITYMIMKVTQDFNFIKAKRLAYQVGKLAKKYVNHLESITKELAGKDYNEENWNS